VAWCLAGAAWRAQQLDQHAVWGVGADPGGGRVQRDAAHTLTALNVHRLLITAVLLAGAARACLRLEAHTARLRAAEPGCRRAPALPVCLALCAVRAAGGQAPYVFSSLTLPYHLFL